MKNEKIKYIIIAILILASGLIYSFFLSEDNRPSEVSLDPQTEESSLITSDTEIFVYVCGQVMNPGVYSFKQGDRICDAIEKAGGITSEGNIEGINLADLLEDGQMIKILSITEDSETEDDGLIDLNNASKEVLMSLPGIGETKAQGIISYRENTGSFISIEDVMKVEGIKETLFSKIKDLIKV